MTTETKDRFKQFIQKYINDMKRIMNEHGDAKLDAHTMYGGTTLAEEIKLAEERMARI